MEISAAPGSTIPVRVLGDEVVDARVGAWVYTIAMMLLFLLTALVTVVLPAVWFARRSRSRSRVRRHLDESGEQVLRVGHAAIRHRDGTLFAKLHSTHPGPDFPPLSCRITVTSPAGAPYYTVDFGVPDYRRGETVAYDLDGRLMAIVRRQLMRPAHADVFGPDEDTAPLATISPADRLGPVERAVIGPQGERLGTVLAGQDDALEPTVLGIRPGAPEPLRAGVLGFALTRERFYPGPRLEQAHDEWLRERDHLF
ncbi:hypothetical protein [Actinomadura sp. B10D3]|uniref:hypothetical protein n=1 Tax=Actinomadura sp. B10D3 TaxID=3153557 RepID=UPI00325EE36A